MARRTRSPGEVAGLKLLRDRLGDRFRQGILLHLGAQTIPIGDWISAVPLAGLCAQAEVESFALVTSDGCMDDYEVEVVW